MLGVSTTVKLMDTRLNLITDKLNDLYERQERVEASMKLLHESVRKLQPIMTKQQQPLPTEQQQPPLLIEQKQQQALLTQQPLPTQQPPPTHQQQPLLTQEQHQPLVSSCSTPGLSDSTHTPLVISAEPCHGTFLNPSELINIRTSSSSRRNFATHIMRKLFSIHDRKTSNVNGKNKNQLDPIRISFIRKVTFQHFPLKGEENEKKAWSSCVEAIDEANRRLNRNK